MQPNGMVCDLFFPFKILGNACILKLMIPVIVTYFSSSNSASSKYVYKQSILTLEPLSLNLFL